jgi:pyridoxal phosphate enzyme (YggS family)
MRANICAAERRYGRPAGAVTLLAVSKGVSSARIGEAAACGQCCFGESYLREALPKMEALRALELEWHFIGPIQANKTRGIAEHFAWVHSVDRLKIAQRLSWQRPEHLPPLNLCLQVNISEEPQKQGITPEQARATAAAVAQLPRLRLRGLMAIPAPCPDFAGQRAVFARLRQLFEGLGTDGLALDTLSMGMSDDWEAAVAEGSTLVRIGTAVFGARPPETENRGS